MILAFKVIVTPFFIVAVTPAGRNWGPNVSGLLMGLPLTSAPISAFLFIQYNTAYAARSASGNLAGQASVCVFCLVYSLSARKLTRLPATSLALALFLLSTFIWNQFNLSIPAAIAVLGVVICLVLWVMPDDALMVAPSSPPRWDLPARMVLQAAFVFALTAFATSLGPHLSGLIAPFPVFGTINAAFTHHQQGAETVARLLRGVVFGSLAYGTFFLIARSLIIRFPAGWTSLPASLGALGVSAGIFFAPGPLNKKCGSSR